MGSIPITQKAKCSPNKYNASLVAGEAQTFDRFQDASGSITNQGGGGGAPIPPVTKEKKKDDTVKDGIILHIETDDIPKTLAKIKKAGGKVTKEKTDIGNDFGFYALFEDNSGNLLGIWSQK